MREDLAKRFRPVAPPRVIEGAYTEDQHHRLLGVARDHGPWPLILAHHFQSPEEVLATTSGDVPEGVQLSWDMFLSPVFRGYLARGGVCLFPEIEDCYYSSGFLDLVRGYWGARYAEPESMLFNLQGPCAAGGSPHIDGTRFRGVTMENAPTWLLNTMCKSGLFERWRAKKAQVIAWYYRGRLGGGFDYWPDGPHGKPQQIQAPMWGRAVIVENEMMYHAAQSNGPAALRKPQGLGIDSRISPDPEREDGWRITSADRVIQRIPAEEMRFLVHWGAQLYLDDDELRVAQDHTDDLTHDRVFDTFVADLRARGEAFEMPSDPLSDKAFIRLLNRVYDLGTPSLMPPEPEEADAAA
jgi:hypothetical protein